MSNMVTILVYTFSFSEVLNPLSASPTKWSNTLKQFVGKLPTNCLSVFDHFVGLMLRGLRFIQTWIYDDQLVKFFY